MIETVGLLLQIVGFGLICMTDGYALGSWERIDG